MSTLRLVMGCAMGLVIAAAPVAWGDDGAGNPDSDLATSANPDRDDASAASPDDLAHSESPDADAHAYDPNADAHAESPDADLAPSSPARNEDQAPEAALVLPPPASCDAPAGDPGWVACLRDARAQIDTSRSELANAEAAYTRSLTNEVDLGGARRKIVEDREIAKAHLALAEQRLPLLVERARRSGASQSVLDPYGG
jgi:hypothetical protein